MGVIPAVWLFWEIYRYTISSLGSILLWLDYDKKRVNLLYGSQRVVTEYL